MSDGLSTLYQDLLGGSYDCVDRIDSERVLLMGETLQRVYNWAPSQA